jgi:hypothetical protein
MKIITFAIVTHLYMTVQGKQNETSIL